MVCSDECKEALKTARESNRRVGARQSWPGGVAHRPAIAVRVTIMKPCCDLFIEGLESLNACILFCANQSAGPKYQYAFFKYCPWCGVPVRESPQQIASSPSPDIRTQPVIQCDKCHVFHCVQRVCLYCAARPPGP